MSYLVLARKWRPKQFAGVIAQQHVTQTIANAIQQNRLASAYLFAGPRGVGKTTMARLLAKAVNCQNGPTPTPCDECVNCREITAGRSLDVIEIDGASNRGIDEVRNLRDNARFAPANSLKKIYIIDEVHMLTEPAFNALLKIIEEPPPHVLFVFATTEIHKVPATILSRCQRFDFRRVPVAEMVDQLKMICASEGVAIEDSALYIIARRAEGSMRDSQSLLDQVISYCGMHITRADVSQLFGLIEQDLFFECTDMVVQHDARQAVLLCDQIHNSGVHLGEFFERLAEHLSHILATRLTGDAAHLSGLESFVERYRSTAAALSELVWLQLLQQVTEAQARLARTTNPRILLEVTLLRMAHTGAPEASPGGTNPKSAVPAPAPAQPVRERSTSAAAPAAPKFEGVALVPQIAPVVVEASPVAVRPGPAPAATGLFHPGLLARVQEVPVVKAREAAVPLAAGIEDAKQALQKIQACWPAILEQVKARRISLGAFLELGVPRSLVDGTLEVCFSSENGFHLNTVNNQKTLIQQVIQAETGYAVRLVCRKEENWTALEAAKNGESTAAAPVATATAPAGSQQAHTLEDLFASYPLVQQFVEAVDGEFTRRYVRS